MPDLARWQPSRLPLGRTTPLLVAMALIVLLPAGAGAQDWEDDPLSADLRAVADEAPLVIGWFRGSDPVVLIEDGRAVGGIGVTMWDLMAIRTGLRVEHVVFDDVAAVVAALRDGDIDLAGMHGDRPDLQEFAGRTDPLLWERLTFLGAPSAASMSLDELVGVRVSALPGSPMEAALRESFPQAILVPTASLPDGLRAAAEGDIELYLTPLAVGGHLARDLDLDLVPVGDNIRQIPASTWAVDGSAALQIARAARATLTDQEISVLTQRFTGYDLGPDNGTQTPAWVWQALLVSGIAAILLAGFSLALRRRVAGATAELRRLNDELEDRVARRTAELSMSNQALTRVAHTTAHDLRGPVAAIAGLADLLNHVDMSDEQRRDVLTTIASSAKRLGTMIQTVVDDAVTSGADAPEMRTEEFVTWLREIAAPEVDAIGGVLDIEAGPGRLEADVTVLQRAAVNLVGNAAKYALNPEGTHIVVRLDETNGGWHLSVDDNGPGIRAADRQRIFEEGYQMHPEVADGWGLGLAELRAMAEEAGGTVTVTASPLGGARFSVELPALASAASGQSSEPPTSQAGSSSSSSLASPTR